MDKAQERMDREYRFSAPVRVRFIETDAAGIAHHASFFSYLEVGRVEYLRLVGIPFDEINRRVTLTIARVECDYKAPARFDDLLLVYTRMSEFGRSSFTTLYEIRRESDQALIASARTVHVALDRETGSPIPVPDFIIEPVERFEGGVPRRGADESR